MAYKNWERNYHAERKGNNWSNKGFFDWWDFEKDWKKFVNEGARLYGWRPRKELEEMSFFDYQFRARALHPYMERPILSLTLEEVNELTDIYGKIERKKKLAAGGYKSGRKTYFKKLFNSRRRAVGRKYCNMALEDRLDEADYWLNQDKDKRFAWIVD